MTMLTKAVTDADVDAEVLGKAIKAMEEQKWTLASTLGEDTLEAPDLT